MRILAKVFVEWRMGVDLGGAGRQERTALVQVEKFSSAIEVFSKI